MSHFGSWYKFGVWFSLLIALSFLEAKGQKVNEKWPVLTAEPTFQDTITAAVDSLYNRHLHASDQLIDPWKKRYPTHPVWFFWKGLEQWWDILEDLDDRSKDEAFFETMDRTVDACDRVLDSDPVHQDAMMIKAVALGLHARQQSNRQNWWDAMNKGRAAMRTLEQLRDVDPDNSELLFADGLYHYYVAHIHQNYKALRVVTWMMDGNKELGLDQLKKASQHSLFVRSEATYFLANILLNYENDASRALSYSHELTRKFPDNLYYNRLYIRSLISAHHYGEALIKVNETMDYWGDDQAKELEAISSSDVMALQEEMLTWRGRLLYKENQYEKALTNLEEATRLSEQLPGGKQRSFYLQASYLRGKCHMELNELEMAKHWFSQVVDSDGDSGYKDEARQMLKRIKRQ